jgi:hypothetical protein
LEPEKCCVGVGSFAAELRRSSRPSRDVDVATCLGRWAQTSGQAVRMVEVGGCGEVGGADSGGHAGPRGGGPGMGQLWPMHMADGVKVKKLTS